MLGRFRCVQIFLKHYDGLLPDIILFKKNLNASKPSVGLCSLGARRKADFWFWAPKNGGKAADWSPAQADLFFRPFFVGGGAGFFFRVSPPGPRPPPSIFEQI